MTKRLSEGGCIVAGAGGGGGRSLTKAEPGHSGTRVRADDERERARAQQGSLCGFVVCWLSGGTVLEAPDQRCSAF